MSPNRHRRSFRKGRPVQPIKGLMQVILRWLFRLTGQRQRSPQAGFVFPTTLLLLLMVTLTATALTYRTFSRSEQVITQRDQQVIYNAATPAIDRARAKIEFLFQEDPRLPSGVPPSDRLSDMLLPEDSRVLLNTAVSPAVPIVGDIQAIGGGTITDPYTLPDENRLDLNNDGDLDNAWLFNIDDLDGDGTAEKVVYSIILDDIGPGSTAPDGAGAIFTTDSDDAAKANALVTRTGPPATTEATPICKAAVAEAGWQVVTQGNNSSLQKNFQVNAFVVNSRTEANPTFNPTFETLEFQQSRIASRASKWGAWFRYDMEISPGSAFNWNGAMHSDGNIILYRQAAKEGIEPYMVSSEKSCIYSKESSEITLGEFDNDGTDGIDIGTNTATTDFQGQLMLANTTNSQTATFNKFGSDNTIRFHTFSTNNAAPNTIDIQADDDGATADFEGDSVRGLTNAARPADVAMNPLKLFTEDKEEHINPGTWQRDPGWENSPLFTNDRVKNDPVSRPFVDDFYRADDRWGPKPRYGSANPTLDLTQLPNTTLGSNIKNIDSNADYNAGTENLLINPEDGLDGYWERQAVKAGLRIIVGQRLELGNANGWGYSPTEDHSTPSTLPANAQGDPLYPPKVFDTSNVNRFGGRNVQLHRKSLRDNLAAVQGMVVYHYEVNDGQFPAACMAVTAHPGTRETILNSRTFERYPLRDDTDPAAARTGDIRADFLNGMGTNGWEFTLPTGYDTEAEFASAIANDQPLGKALRNWAYFAGDPLGGAPSFKPTQDPIISDDPATAGIDESDNGVTHPYPYLSMWGDASPLRRIFDDYLDSGTLSYANLSPADKSTLHSAACTISLLGYNINSLRTAFNDITDAQWGAIATDLLARVEAGDANQILLTDAESTTPAEWIRAAVAAGSDSLKEDRMRVAVNYLQVDRDRTHGFNFLPGILDQGTNTVGTYVVGTGTFTLPADTTNFTAGNYRVGCDPNFFATKGITDAEQSLTLALALCPKVADAGDSLNVKAKAVKYPSLYYLFPYADHGHATNQPTDEEYIDDNPGDGVDSYVGATNTGATRYKVVDTDIPADPVTGSAAEPADPELLDDIAATPRGASGWELPDPTLAADVLDDPQTDPFTVEYAGASYVVPMLDKGIYDGRERLNTRVLDIDLKALTTQRVGTGDYWLPADTLKQAEGVVYAFREDAVREDEIVRPSPAATDSAFCSTVNPNGIRTFNLEHDANCYTQFLDLVAGTVPQDPPLTPNLISLKPVDFVPDGERRAHGFRLRTRDGTPADFSGGTPSNDDARKVGMTFVTDNSVYIMGDFNPHTGNGSTAAANLLEEFDEKILGGAFGFADFYGGNRETLNTSTFSVLTADHWRPVEVLSDSMTILSGSFRDGWVSDGFTKELDDDETTFKPEETSYTNMDRPNLNNDRNLADVFLRENLSDPGSPMWLDRNGVFYWIADGPVESYFAQFTGTNVPNRSWVFSEGQRHDNVQLPQENNIFVNAIFVSGIVPRRTQQGYGGLHNYPRFLEYWNGKSVNIQGAFLQLNFSTAGTGPYEREAYEPGSTPGTGEDTGYYWNPNRRWGYDVGLLYVPPSAAARRFVSLGNARSEYYREVPVDDAYIKNLRCAEDDNGNKVFPNLTNIAGDACPA